MPDAGLQTVIIAVDMTPENSLRNRLQRFRTEGPRHRDPNHGGHPVCLPKRLARRSLDAPDVRLEDLNAVLQDDILTVWGENNSTESPVVAAAASCMCRCACPAH